MFGLIVSVAAPVLSLLVVAGIMAVAWVLDGR